MLEKLLVSLLKHDATFFPDSDYNKQYMRYPSFVGPTPGYPRDSGLRRKGSNFMGNSYFYCFPWKLEPFPQSPESSG